MFLFLLNCVTLKYNHLFREELENANEFTGHKTKDLLNSYYWSTGGIQTTPNETKCCRDFGFLRCIVVSLSQNLAGKLNMPFKDDSVLLKNNKHLSFCTFKLPLLTVLPSYSGTFWNDPTNKQKTSRFPLLLSVTILSNI